MSTKSFKKKYGALIYSSFIKVSFIIYLVAFVLSLEDEYPVFNFTKFVIGFSVSSVIIVILYFLRRLVIGHKIMFELDVRTAYELDKRKNPLFKDYNNKLLSYTYFYEGNFTKAVSVCNETLGRTKNKAYTLLARHTKILSKFFGEDTEDIKELIEQQRELKAIVKSADFDFMFKQYQFIEAYLEENYEKSMDLVLSFLKNEKESAYNSRKIVFLQFQKMLYLKNNDTEGIENCNAEILKCDSKRKTFFSELTDINIH